MFRVIGIAGAVAVFVIFWRLDANDDEGPMHPLVVTATALVCILLGGAFYIGQSFLSFNPVNKVDFFALSEVGRGSGFLVFGYGVAAFALNKWVLAIWRRLRVR